VAFLISAICAVPEFALTKEMAIIITTLIANTFLQSRIAAENLNYNN